MTASGQIVKLEKGERYGERRSVSLWWGSGGGALSGVQEQSPWSGGQPLKLKTILLLDTRQTCRACRFFSISQRSVWFTAIWARGMAFPLEKRKGTPFPRVPRHFDHWLVLINLTNAVSADKQRGARPRDTKLTAGF